MEIKEEAKNVMVGLLIVAPGAGILWFKPKIAIAMLILLATTVICWQIGELIRITWGF